MVTTTQREPASSVLQAPVPGRVGALPAYRPELDSLRAYAVILVLLSHWLPPWFVAAYNWGVAGVHLFFAISGYVITRILLVELDRDIHWRAVVRKFYLRRVLRIWPIYYLTCAIAFFVWPRIDSQYAAWHVLFGSNLLDGALSRCRTRCTCGRCRSSSSSIWRGRCWRCS